MPDISPEDRDLITRTVLSEAGDQPDIGKAAVAYTILNRMKAGRYGGTSPTDVIFHRAAFEPWSLPRNDPNHPLAHDYRSSDYRNTADIVDQVLSGQIEDPTGGMTHFYSPKDQAALGRKAPAWAKGEGLAIGGHTFYAPEGAVGAIHRAIGKDGSQGSGGATAFANERGAAFDPEAEFKLWEGKGPAASAAAPAAAKPAEFDPEAEFRLWEGKGPAAAATQAPAAPPGMEPRVPTADDPRTWETPQERAAAVQTGKDVTSDRKSFTTFTGSLPAVASKIGDIGSAIAEHAVAGAKMAQSGISDIKQGVYYPTMPSANPATWTAGGLLKAAAGAVAVPGALMSGPAQELVGKPVTALTGSPELGQKAEFLAGFGVPVAKGASVAAKALPANKAAADLVNAIGRDNLQEVITRMEANPKLAPMDVSETVRNLAQGIAANPEAPAAQALLKKSVMARVADTQAGMRTDIEGALGKMPSAYDTLQALKQKARDTGKTVIEPVVKSTGPVDVTKVVKAIDDAIGADPVGAATLKQLKAGQPLTGPTISDYQRRLFQLRQELRGTWGDRDQMFLDAAGEQGAHQVQAGLRAEAQSMLNSADGGTRNEGARLMAMRNRIVDAIDDASNGKYKPALSSYRDDMQVHEAFDMGRNIGRLRQGEKGITEDSADAWAEWAKTAKPAEMQAARMGVLSKAKDDIANMRAGTMRTDVIPPTELRQDKLAVLFGDKQAEKMMQLVNDARARAETNQRLFQGSKTAATQAAQGAMAIRPAKLGSGESLIPPAALEAAGMLTGGVPGVGTAAYLAGRGIQKAGRMIGRASDISRNTAFARYAAATGADRDTVLAILKREAAKP